MTLKHKKQNEPLAGGTKSHSPHLSSKEFTKHTNPDKIVCCCKDGFHLLVGGYHPALAQIKKGMVLTKPISLSQHSIDAWSRQNRRSIIDLLMAWGQLNFRSRLNSCPSFNGQCRKIIMPIQLLNKQQTAFQTVSKQRPKGMMR